MSLLSDGKNKQTASKIFDPESSFPSCKLNDGNCVDNIWGPLCVRAQGDVILKSCKERNVITSSNIREQLYTKSQIGFYSDQKSFKPEDVLPSCSDLPGGKCLDDVWGPLCVKSGGTVTLTPCHIGKFYAAYFTIMNNSSEKRK